MGLYYLAVTARSTTARPTSAISVDRMAAIWTARARDYVADG
ncbi:MAG: hypothetical protein M5U09_25300 [Gammaproteobacteria bacterium]|nr:hypothetical protein [Gammaproteobacteria bacterium]